MNCKKDRIDNETIIEVLTVNAGNKSESAGKLGVSRNTLATWIKEDDELQEAFEDIEESTIDLCESQLMKNIKDGKETSLIYKMNCKGRHRGYGNFKQIEIKSDPNKDEPVPEEYL